MAKKRLVSIYMPPELHLRLKKRAAEAGRTLSSLIESGARAILADWTGGK